MTKAEMVENVQLGSDLSRKEAAELVEEAFGIMKRTIEAGETLKIYGFGSFIVKQKADRRGRNPQTGDSLTIEARRVLTFKPSALLREAINESPMPSR